MEDNRARCMYCSDSGGRNSALENFQLASARKRVNKQNRSAGAAVLIIHRRSSDMACIISRTSTPLISATRPSMMLQCQNGGRRLAQL
jgi:hypothetical protein